MDLSKITSSKTFKVAAWIALPTLLVAGFYGYKLIKKKIDEKKAEKERTLADLKKTEMQEKYKEIKSVDDFLEAVKYLDETNQYGYDFTQFDKKKLEIEKIPFDKLKRLYELAKKGQVAVASSNDTGRTNKEDEEFLDLIHLIFP